MLDGVQKLQTAIERKKGMLDQLKRQKQRHQTKLDTAKKDLERHEKIREIIRIVGEETQKKLAYHIGDIASLALETIFPDPYELVVDFVHRRNKTECDLLFRREGQGDIDPITAAGGGVVDVASFTLRVASLAMNLPPLRRLLVLDEPFKHLSATLLPLASQVFEEISKKLQIQIIYVTHATELLDAANIIYSAERGRNGITKVSRAN